MADDPRSVATSREEEERLSSGALDGLAGYHLRLASNAFGADFARALEGTGVRQVLFGIMAIVAATPGVHQGAVGRALGIKRANMVALINELVDRGMIKREASPSDRRAFELALTPEGEALLADAHARIRAHENKMLARLTAAERQTLIGLLKKIP